MSGGRTCATCLHRWHRSTASDPDGCGKEIVRQITQEAARAENGDCGPEGKYWRSDYLGIT